jgi:DNA polymerase-3 subunit gamma/tau
MIPTKGEFRRRMTEQATDKTPYKVLARKYRPGTFSELIGQEPMVRTLRNAIEQDRLAHAFILTGVRGVGKTTTARLVARALNCIGADGTGGPTVDPCGVCEHCLSIAESRHIDVLEMDAASRTGVDDIREIIEGVRYAPGSARFKIYIIDEVHMLSRNAFNALLKTLEEPPEHVKFVFATTEIRKVPITVLSRCQRFDLRRIETATLAEYFTDIAGREDAEIEPQAIDLIARAADGSVRDGLSLLDQAIAHGAGKTTTEQVRTMLGLADRLLVMDLFESLMGGDIQAALLNMRDQYNAGADPVTTMQDLLELTHWITQLKAVPDAGESLSAPEAERTFGAAMASKLSMPVLTRAWQMLLKGLEEVRLAPMPLSAAEMALIRLAYAADLPSPADLVKKLQKEGPVTSTPATAAPATPAPAPTAQAPTPQTPAAPEATQQPVATLTQPATKATGGGQVQMVAQPEPEPDPEPQSDPEAEAMARAWGPTDFGQVLAMCREKKELRLEVELTNNVHLVSFQPGQIELRLTEKARPNLPNVLSQMLRDWTGQNWMVMVSKEDGDQTLRAQRLAHEKQIHDEVSVHPLVVTALETFPGAKITSVVEPEEPEIDETYSDEEDDEE